jgi:hypothetical protein
LPPQADLGRRRQWLANGSRENAPKLISDKPIPVLRCFLFIWGSTMHICEKGAAILRGGAKIAKSSKTNLAAWNPLKTLNLA